ncbi:MULTISPECIES: hypothetical protein [unclassified Bradyrhizobium]|uniref:hypothetical protein n=1 Tax=unclassified Bradyrhizobium TaxID=2631580 RepID=UPI002916B0FB|nr:MULTISPECIES: hypothetical protein [unclassified Bradyrhizobium]
MRLAAEADIHIMFCSQVFTLRATLRAAYCLNRKYRGFANLAKAIQEGSFSAYQDVIKAGCADDGALNAFLKPFNASDADITPLGEVILGNRHELLEFVVILAGGTQDQDGQTGQPTKLITHEELHTQLYQAGTGLLGWTPEDTWEAKPSEIINANQGRFAFVKDLLGVVFGKQEHGSTIDGTDKLTAEMRAELNAIGRGAR